MRAATSSHRRLHPPPSSSRRVDAVAHLVDEGTIDDPDHLILHVVDEGHELLLGVKPLATTTHPFVELAGCTAPVEWSMFGLRVHGTARYLDGDQPAERSSTTFVVDRDGAECSVLRTDRRSTVLPGPACGTIPDLCRRVLGLPTEPAPPTTAPLWTVAWLDGVIEAWGDPERRHQLSSSWADVAALHPAVRSAPGGAIRDLDDPGRLVAVAGAHATAWSWARLREDPDALPLPDGHLPPEITRWMDDGFYARWALGAFPSPAALAHDISGLFDADVRTPFLAALAGVLDVPMG